MDNAIQKAVDLTIFHERLKFLELIEEFIDDGSGQIDYSESLWTLKTIAEGDMCEAAEKAGFEHFMMKEIHEQPRAILDTLNSKLKDGKIDLSDVGLSDEDIKSLFELILEG